MDELIQRRDADVLRFKDTLSLMRKYMETGRPQSFASIYNLFERLRGIMEIYGVYFEVNDILEYAKKEHIERYGFY